jgi:hypothetical protein
MIEGLLNVEVNLICPDNLSMQSIRESEQGGIKDA